MESDQLLEAKVDQIVAYLRREFQGAKVLHRSLDEKAELFCIFHGEREYQFKVNELFLHTLTKEALLRYTETTDMAALIRDTYPSVITLGLSGIRVRPGDTRGGDGLPGGNKASPPRREREQ